LQKSGVASPGGGVSVDDLGSVRAWEIRSSASGGDLDRKGGLFSARAMSSRAIHPAVHVPRKRQEAPDADRRTGSH